MFGLPDNLPGIVIIFLSIVLFVLTVLMPLFVMLIYFELKNIRRDLHKATTTPEDEKRVKELQQQLRKRR